MMFTSLFLNLVVSAALVTGAPGDKKVDYSHEQDKGSVELIGKGLRKKKVAFIGVKVYDAFVYAADPAAFKRDDGALDSLDAQKAVAIRLKFLRDVDAPRIVASYKESLVANKVDLDSPPIKEALAKIEAGGEVKEGQTMSLLGLKKADGEILIYENGKGDLAVIKGGAGFLKQIYSIWFGHMAESTMEDLKKDLLKTP